MENHRDHDHAHPFARGAEFDTSHHCHHGYYEDPRGHGDYEDRSYDEGGRGHRFYEDRGYDRGGRGRGDYEDRGDYEGGWGRGGAGRSRMRRGDVRAAILALLSEEPMHGYQLMQAIAERGNGRWTPSPGAIYPAISQLEDEGLVTVTAEAGRRLVTLTDTGREAAQTHIGRARDLFSAGQSEQSGTDLRSLLGQLHQATREVARGGTEVQVEAAAEIISDASRSMKLLLAGEQGDGHE
jgi:DNA-binding PadR family transcriptional regulator